MIEVINAALLQLAVAVLAGVVVELIKNTWF